MSKKAFPALRPGATIGILGGGQLGRMLAQAAGQLGLHCHIYAPETDSCAFEVVRRATIADYLDRAALDAFAQDCDVVTYEFENVPAETADFLAARKNVFPDPKILALTQDRLIEKDFVAGLKIPTAPYAAVGSAAELEQAVGRIGLPAILKTRRLGYDGKGQVMIRKGDDLGAAWRALGQVPCILEGFVRFACEVSVIVARGRDGKAVSFDVAENVHRDHILKTTKVPAAISVKEAARARKVAEKIAVALGYVGVMAVEMFVVKGGNERAVVVNEIAPRVHNSGHWTLDGCTVSQFEQHIRAVAGWSLARPVRLGRAEMTNLIGREAADYTKFLTLPGASVHLYGKDEARPGRKMGHVTRVFPAKSPAKSS